MKVFDMCYVKEQAGDRINEKRRRQEDDGYEKNINGEEGIGSGRERWSAEEVLGARGSFLLPPRSPTWFRPPMY
eukprot:768810-Hanusia_phi.AAC.12